MDEGYIKFNCNWIKGEPLAPQKWLEINKWRDILYELGLIGAGKDGIGFGNISIRSENNTFIITGSATGNLNSLNGNHYVVVNDYDLGKNSLTCTGPIKASSESLSHAAVYECSPETNAVIHIHNITMWEKYIHIFPTSSENVQYGTPGMAEEIKRLFKETNVRFEKMIVMGGHREGLISFGTTMEDAGKILLDKFKTS